MRARSQGHQVTCRRFPRCPGSGRWVLVRCPDHQPACPAPSLVPQDRHGGFRDTWFGTFSGQTDLPCSHRWSHPVMPLCLGSWLHLCRFPHLLNSELGSKGWGQPPDVMVIREPLDGPHSRHLPSQTAPRVDFPTMALRLSPHSYLPLG